MGHEIVSISPDGRPDLDEPWLHGVEWCTASLDSPGAWRELLTGADAVIDCAGIIDLDPSNPGHADEGEVTRIAAEEAESAGVETFVFISTAELSPVVPDAILDARRSAERCLEDRHFDVAILRPAVITAHDRPDAFIISGLLDLLSAMPGGQAWVQEQSGIEIEKVAMCALRAALDPDIEGILDVQDIEYFGDAMILQ